MVFLLKNITTKMIDAGPERRENERVKREETLVEVDFTTEPHKGRTGELGPLASVLREKLGIIIEEITSYDQHGILVILGKYPLERIAEIARATTQGGRFVVRDNYSGRHLSSPLVLQPVDVPPTMAAATLEEREEDRFDGDEPQALD